MLCVNKGKWCYQERSLLGSLLALVAMLLLKQFGFSVFPLSQADDLAVQLHYKKIRNAAFFTKVKHISTKVLSIYIKKSKAYVHVLMGIIAARRRMGA